MDDVMQIAGSAPTTGAERQELARHVRSLRQSAGLTQGGLASLAGVSRQTVSNLERGTVPQGETLRTVLTALGVEPDQSSFSAETETWLVMIGTIIESLPPERRVAAVDRAVRVLSADVLLRGPVGATVGAASHVGGVLDDEDLQRIDLSEYDLAATDDDGGQGEYPNG